MTCTLSLKCNKTLKPTPYHSHRKIAVKPRKRKEALWIDYKDPNQKEDGTPFRFTGKERDLETGLYYYGARYLDPKTSRWMSTDPAMGEYVPTPGQDISKLSGMGGVFNTINMHTYHYAANNPVKYVDPDGEYVATPWTIASIATGVASLAVNIKKGDKVGIVIDSLGILADAACLITGTGGGFGMAAKIARGASVVADVVQSANGAVNAYEAAKDGDGLGVAAGVASAVSPGLGRAAGKGFDKAAEYSPRFFTKYEDYGNILSGAATVADTGAIVNKAFKKQTPKQQSPSPPPSQNDTRKFGMLENASMQKQIAITEYSYE